MKALRLAVSALLLAIVSAEDGSTTGVSDPASSNGSATTPDPSSSTNPSTSTDPSPSSGSPTVPSSSTQAYPYYDADGYLIIRDPKINERRPVHEDKVDYSQHGKNWDPVCPADAEEQSPLNLSW